MDSDKAAVWVTNWDTERNGSSLTTRDGTSYLLANAFMLAYDYGQPHIFSGYYYAGATPANWAGTRKYDPSDPAWFTGETPHKGDDTAAKSADSAASAKSGDAKSGKATSDAIRRAATLAAILLPVIVGVTFMAIARRNGKAQSDNSGPNND